PIFDNFDISKQIKSLFAKFVSLRRGAYLIIEHTEAMNVIDVNSGNRTKAEDNQEQTAMDVNLAAAAEIARQLRLRDLGGIVIIDFIDLHKAPNRQALYDEMVKLMITDKAKHTVLPLTKFGLMQITRQRVRPVAVEGVTDVCPTCNGTGKIEPTILLDKKIENQISFLSQDRKQKFIKLVVSPYVASFLCKGLISLRRRWQWRYKTNIQIVADQSVGMVDVHYRDKKGADLINKV
ncbi:MAG: ribonuclease E/G, partial [Alistipes sp.]